MIKTPGLYNLSDEQYHADPCEVPSLSSSIAKLLLDRTPFHAWYKHPRLNRAFDEDESSQDKFNLGSASHDYMLQGGRSIEVVDAKSWQTKDARAAKEMILAAGRIPLLRHQFYQVEEMARMAQIQLSESKEDKDAYQVGQAEQTIIWQEPNGIWCRSKIDWMPDMSRSSIVYDHKTTSGSAHPNAFAKQLFGLGYDVQAAFYLRGLRTLFPAVDWRFRFTPQEVEPPFLLSIVELPPAVLALADRKVETAIDLWQRCMTTGEWPAYPAEVCFPDMPGWAEHAWISRENDEMLARERGIDLFQVGMRIRL